MMVVLVRRRGLHHAVQRPDRQTFSFASPGTGGTRSNDGRGGEETQY
jgi:hypothetical protein